MSIVPQRRQYCLTSTLFQHQQSNDDSLCIFNLLSMSTQCLGSDFRRWFWLFNQRNLARWAVTFFGTGSNSYLSQTRSRGNKIVKVFPYLGTRFLKLQPIPNLHWKSNERN